MNERYGEIAGTFSFSQSSGRPSQHPYARAMARMTKVGAGYNVQLGVDTEDKMIVEQKVARPCPSGSNGRGGDGHARRRADRGSR